jgi:hypothetical protein
LPTLHPPSPPFTRPPFTHPHLFTHTHKLLHISRPITCLDLYTCHVKKIKMNKGELLRDFFSKSFCYEVFAYTNVGIGELRFLACTPTNLRIPTLSGILGLTYWVPREPAGSPVPCEGNKSSRLYFSSCYMCVCSNVPGWWGGRHGTE